MQHDVERQLAEHGRALRALAADLVGEQQADDLVQDTALAALRRGPSRQGPLGGWLAAIVRHLASKQRRGERRRLLREQRAARPEAEPPADAEVAARDAFARLTAAVLALPPALQGPLLLRYAQDLTPSEIAARTGAPLATVKSQLQRGLAQLRARLDAQGKGGDWRAAFAGAFGLERLLPVGAAAATGVIVMGTGVKLALGGLAAGCVLVTALWLRDVGSVAAPHAAAREVAAVAPAVAAPPAADASASPGEKPGEVREPAPAAAEVVSVRGRCVDEHGRPLAEAEVALRGSEPSFSLERTAQGRHGTPWKDPPDQVTQADGRFAFSLAPREGCKCSINFTAAGRAPLYHVEPAFDRPRVIDLGDVELPVAARLHGRVVDTKGVPQPGVQVELQRLAMSVTASLRPMSKYTTESDASGAFRVDEAIAPGRFGLWSRGRTLAEAPVVELAPGSETDLAVVVLALDSARAIRGRVVDERGLPLAGVEVWPLTSDWIANVRTDADGRFEQLPPERRVDAGIKFLFRLGGYEELRTTDAVPWGSTGLEFTLRSGAELVVTVSGLADAPAELIAEAARIPDGPTSLSFGDQALVHDGVARLQGLVHDQYLVRVRQRGGAAFASAVSTADLRASGPAQVTLAAPIVRDVLLQVRTTDGRPGAGTTVELIDPLGQTVDLDTVVCPRGTGGSGGAIVKTELVQAGRTDARGELRLRGAARHDLALRLVGAGHVRTIVQPFALDAEPTVAVTVHDGATLLVRVDPPLVLQRWREQSGLPLQGSVPYEQYKLPGVRLTRPRHGAPLQLPFLFEAPFACDADGRCRIDGLPAGRWTVQLSYGTRNGGGTIDLAEVDAVVGEAREVTLHVAELQLGELTGHVRLNGQSLAGVVVEWQQEYGRFGDQTRRFGDRAIADANGEYHAWLAGLPAQLSVYGSWPGTTAGDLRITVPGTVLTRADAPTRCDLDLRAERVRFRLRDAADKPVPLVQLQFFGEYEAYGPASDADGCTPWVALATGHWRAVALPQRLRNPGAYFAFLKQHQGETDPARSVLVELGDFTVADADREIELRVPDAWFR